MERRLPPRAARAADRRTGAATSPTSGAPAICQGDHRRASSTTGSTSALRRRRHGAPAAGDAGRAVRGVQPEPRSDRQRLPGAAPRSDGGPGAPEGRGDGAVLRRPRCRCCFRARSTARRRRSTTSPATPIRRWPRPSARGGTRSTCTCSKRGRRSAAGPIRRPRRRSSAAKLRWESLAQPPHAEMLAFYRALIALRRRLAPLHNGRKDLTRVDRRRGGPLG